MTNNSIKLQWMYEDELPTMTDAFYDSLYGHSRVMVGVRMFPYVEINGETHFLC
jgi:hypothetical protein